MVTTSGADMTLLHQTILAMLIFTAASYAARCLFFRAEVRALLGFHDLPGELGHTVCALLMVPMVIPELMSNASLRLGCAAASLVGGVLFMGEGALAQLGRITKYPQYKPWWGYAHGGMYLGMAEMYWIHDHVIIDAQWTQALNYVSGAFYVWFSSYYAFSLVMEAILTRGVGKWTLYFQANVAHLFGIGLPMLGMIFWPATFMPIGSGSACHHASAPLADHADQTDNNQHER